MKLTVTPFPHQAAYRDFALACDYTLLGDEPGVGKTLSAISVAIEMNCPTLVVCPAFLKFNWNAEFLKFTDIKEEEILLINTKKDFRRISPSIRVAIVNYEKLIDCKELFNWAEYVISDESHLLKNLEAKRTQLFHKYIIASPPRRLSLLTGTPVKNRVEEFYSLLTLLSYCPSGKNGKNIRDKFRTQYRFAQHFSHERSFDINVRGRSVTVRKFEGLRNEEELRTYFRGKYMRRLTKDVLDIPEMLEKYVEVSYKYDDSSLKDFTAHQSKLDGHIMSIKTGSALAKAPFTADYAKNLNLETGRPVVIFSDHVASIKLIGEKLKNSAVITGSTPMDERHKWVTEFQAGRLDYILATIGAMSTGVTLTAASDLIFNDMSYVPADNEQASRRINRITQENSCRIHRMCGSHIDKAIMIALTSKQSVLDRII